MSIKALVERYNHFQHDYGQGVDQDYESFVNTLFTPEFKKIANGTELASERAQLLSQLKSVKDSAGNWSVQNLELIPSVDDTKCTNRYYLNSDKAGKFDVIAIITAKQGLIHRIDEVYYQKEGSKNG